MKAIGYMRVSTDEQGDSGAGLEAQERAIRAEVEHRGWELVELRHDVASGKSMRKRGALGMTLRDLAAGHADTLVVAKLDRLSRSVLDFAAIMETAKDEGWSVAVLDLAIDTTTTNGELIANIMIALAQWERRLIGDRTKAALVEVKRRGTPLGRRANVAPSTMTMISTLRRGGLSWRAIAQVLEDDGVPTSQGGKWHGATVRRIWQKHQAA